MPDAAFLETLRKSQELWSSSKASSIEQWLALIDDDVTWTSLADGAPGMEFSKSVRGKAQVEQYFQQLAEDWEMLDCKMDDFISEGDRVVAIGTHSWKHRRTGKSVTTPKVEIVRVKDGKIVEFFEMYDTAKAIAAATEDA